MELKQVKEEDAGQEGGCNMASRGHLQGHHDESKMMFNMNPRWVQMVQDKDQDDPR